MKGRTKHQVNEALCLCWSGLSIPLLFAATAFCGAALYNSIQCTSYLYNVVCQHGEIWRASNNYRSALSGKHSRVEFSKAFEPVHHGPVVLNSPCGTQFLHLAKCYTMQIWVAYKSQLVIMLHTCMF